MTEGLNTQIPQELYTGDITKLKALFGFVYNALYAPVAGLEETHVVGENDWKTVCSYIWSYICDHRYTGKLKDVNPNSEAFTPGLMRTVKLTYGNLAARIMGSTIVNPLFLLQDTLDEVPRYGPLIYHRIQQCCLVPSSVYLRMVDFWQRNIPLYFLTLMEIPREAYLARDYDEYVVDRFLIGHKRVEDDIPLYFPVILGSWCHLTGMEQIVFDKSVAHINNIIRFPQSR